MPERFSWILPQHLAVGSFPDLTDSVNYLKDKGITAILCLTEEAERTVPATLRQSFVWQRIPIPDGYTGGIPSEAHFAEALQVLEQWQQQGEVSYVHCYAGIGRSASVCAAYLVQRQGIKLEEAVRQVKKQHPWANPDLHQLRVMQNFFGR
jgi:atypical dual specificity phosphatase